MHEEVERAITAMWERYHEPISLSDLADVAILSRFYFSRVFYSATGTSPGRFLAAIRVFRAKNLLLETSLSVTDISYNVGYNSPGTFTSRFTRSVGMPPTLYRWQAQHGMPPLEPTPATGPHRGVVTGSLELEKPQVPSRVYVAAFSGPFPDGAPCSIDVLEPATRDRFRLNSLPDGAWFLRSAAVATRDLDPRPWKRRPLLVGGAKPVEVRSGRGADVAVEMHPPTILDLPILLALPELDCREAPASETVGLRQPSGS